MTSAKQKTETGAGASLCLRFVGEAFSVRRALKQLREAARPCDLSEDQLGTIELVLGEVLNNVVEHAYGTREPGEIEMTCARRDGMLAFTVRDFGEAMPEGRLPAGLPVDLNRAREDLPEGGFGWFLVRSLAKGLEYRREEGCNHLSFCMPLADFADAGGSPGSGG